MQAACYTCVSSKDKGLTNENKHQYVSNKLVYSNDRFSELSRAEIACGSLSRFQVSTNFTGRANQQPEEKEEN
jgi:hypothetical protein